MAAISNSIRTPARQAYTPNPAAVRVGRALMIASARGELPGRPTQAWRLERANEAVQGLVTAIRAARPWLRGVLDHLEPQDDCDGRGADIDLWLQKAMRDAVTLRERIGAKARKVRS